MAKCISYIFGACAQFLAHSFQNPWDFLSVRVIRCLLFINEVTFGIHLRMEADYQEDQLCAWKVETVSPTRNPSLPNLPEGERLNRPMANDLINCDYAMKPP